MNFNKLVSLCKERSVSFYRLEKDLGFGNGTISGWARSSPNVSNLKRVADYFGVTLDALMRDDA